MKIKNNKIILNQKEINKLKKTIEICEEGSKLEEKNTFSKTERKLLNAIFGLPKEDSFTSAVLYLTDIVSNE